MKVSMGICGLVVDRSLEVAMGKGNLDIKKVNSVTGDLMGEADVGVEVIPRVDEVENLV